MEGVHMQRERTRGTGKANAFLSFIYISLYVREKGWYSRYSLGVCGGILRGRYPFLFWLHPRRGPHPPPPPQPLVR